MSNREHSISKTNAQLWGDISGPAEHKYTINLNSQFDSDYTYYRDAVSEISRKEGIDWRCVYLSADDWAGVTINSSKGATLGLIINLQYYYVYGFYINSEVYSYCGEGTTALRGYGFDIPDSNIIPYGDSYPDIESGLTTEQVEAIKNTTVTLDIIDTSIADVADMSKDWTDKNADLLRMFWSLVEGVRFYAISDVVNELVEGGSTDYTFYHFYNYAENWKNYSVDAYNDKKLDPNIAVYELWSVGIPG